MTFRKGDLEYEEAHRKMHRERGVADGQNCVDCGKPAVHMTWIHDTDQFNPINYDPRCRSCHFDYDEVNRGSKNGNAKLGESDVLEIRRLYSVGSITQKELGAIYGVAEQTIGNIVNRRKWRHI